MEPQMHTDGSVRARRSAWTHHGGAAQDRSLLRAVGITSTTSAILAKGDVPWCRVRCFSVMAGRVPAICASRGGGGWRGLPPVACTDFEIDPPQPLPLRHGPAC